MTTNTKKVENVKSYDVVVVRKDGEMINVYTGTNFADAKTTWEGLDESWAKSVKESRPFKLITDSVITAFDPALVLEIRLVTVEIESNRAYSPYNQSMTPGEFAKQYLKNLKETKAKTEEGLLDEGYN